MRGRPERIDVSEHAVRYHVVEAEVEMSREKHGNRDVVETIGRHRVASVENVVEIVRIPIIASESEDGKPGIRSQRVSLRQGQVFFSGERGKEKWLEVEGKSERAAHPKVRPRRERFVAPRRDDVREARNPHERV